MNTPIQDKRDYMAGRLPNGTTVEVGLFTSLPDDDGNGGVECADATYAREATDAWTETVSTGRVRRSNSNALTLPALTGTVRARGWGIWTAGGDLLHWGPTRTSEGTVIVVDFAAGDEPEFAVGDLYVEF